MSDDHEEHLRAHREILRYAHENNLFATKEKPMSQLTNVRDKVVAVLTSVIAVAVAVSQAGAEVVEALTSWDGQLVNLVALVPAVIFAIRRVTPVGKEERGLT